MRVVYTAPNRAHHYAYALALANANVLEAFVSGFSRFSPRAPLPELKSLLVRRDHVQNAYLASLRLGAPHSIQSVLSHLSKSWLDLASSKYAKNGDVFLFYNGAGLTTARKLRSTGVQRVVEVVNSHVLIQEEILREEHRRLGLSFSPFFRPEVERRLAEYAEADFILGPSEFVERSFLDRGFPPEKLVRVRYGFDFPQVNAKVERSPDIFRVLYVGQISIRKGLRYLIDAFRDLRHPNKELVIVGPTAKPSGLENISIPPGVRFEGVLKGAALREAYQKASVFVLPSLEEGLALVLGEALAAGLPIIATCNSGASDLYQHGTAGWITPIRDSIAIRDGLQQLVDDQKIANAMACKAIELSRQLGGWEAAGKSLVAKLCALSGNRDPL